MKPVSITTAEKAYIPFNLPGGVTVNVLRLDYMDEETFDEMQSAVEALDVEQQFVSVAADIAESKPGTKLQWQPLMDATKKRLTDLGVEIERVVNKDGTRIDEVTADADVAELFEEYAGQKPRPLHKRARAIAMTMLKFVLDEDELKHFDGLLVGQLNLILSEWRKNSRVTVGE